MNEFTHGGDWAAYERKYGRAALDFSSNVSPLGVPEGVRRAVRAAAERADRYPDPACRALRAAIAAEEDAERAWVLCGAGAADLIWRAVYAAQPRKALVTAPCFGEYEAALRGVSREVRRCPPDGEFRLGEAFLSAIDGQVDLVFLCQPNNPSGVSINPMLLRRVAARCAETGARLVLDECFTGFLDSPEQYSLAGELASYSGLVILKAFTKLYGMAGLRLGYALSADTAFLDAMGRQGPPWSVSTPAQEAGLAALADRSYPEQVRELIRRERPLLARRLSALGLRVIPGEANFLLFRGPEGLKEALERRGILLRCCADFSGLDGSWYRTAVRTREENEALLAALREVLQ